MSCVPGKHRTKASSDATACAGVGSKQGGAPKDRHTVTSASGVAMLLLGLDPVRKREHDHGTVEREAERVS